MAAKRRFASVLLAPLASGVVFCGAGADAAAPRLIPFPADAAEVARHCMAIAATAQTAGAHFTNSTRAAPMTAEAQALHKSVVTNGGLSRVEIERWNSDAALVQERVTETIERIGKPERGQYHSDRVFDELDQHVAECQSWLGNRPPMLAALPADKEAALEHCVLVAAAARGLQDVKGPLRAQAMRAAGNAREVMQELESSGRFKGRNIRERLAAPKGELYLAGVDVALGLKILRMDDEVDARSVKLVDERVRQCHRTFGLQMPLQ